MFILLSKSHSKILLGVITIALALLGLRFVLHISARADGNKFAATRAKQKLGGLSSNVAAKIAANGSPTITLLDGHEVVTDYVGNEGAVRALRENRAVPLALAADDFDEDGIADLVAAYSDSAAGGIIALQRGNPDAGYPNSLEAQQRKAAGAFTDAPFFSQARVFNLPLCPDFIGAGDFNNDGHRDLVIAARGTGALYFLPGDGRGNFGNISKIDLPGAVTALECGDVNRQDGLQDVVVAVAGAAGAKLLVFESPEGALKATPESFDLPGAASSLAVDILADDSCFDIAVTTGNQLLVIAGRDRRLSQNPTQQAQVKKAKIYRRTFASPIKTLVAGDFNQTPGRELTLLLMDGSLIVVGKTHEKASPLSSLRGLASSRFPTAIRLLRASIAGESCDNLIVLDSANHRLHLITSGKAAKEKKSKFDLASQVDGMSVAEINLDSEPVAALPMQLNGDALSDVVILRRNQSSIIAVTTDFSSIFTVTSTSDSGTGSLRQAIMDANSIPGSEIVFSISEGGPQTITVTDALPTITETVTIDGTTQPGFLGSPIIEVQYANEVPIDTEITVSAPSTVIKGLVINDVLGSPPQGNAIALTSTATGCTISGNYIGTDLTGTMGFSNGGSGITINSSGNTIGGTTTAARNLISGNNNNGVAIVGSSATGNNVQGNFIGPDVNGTAAIGNNIGVLIFSGATGNTIGGTSLGARNIISGNFSVGLLLQGSGITGNLIQGNFIGTDVNGTAALSDGVGLQINQGANTNTVGGTAAGARNVISGNSGGGILFQDTGTTSNLVQGNYIGLKATGAGALANGTGIFIQNGAGSNTIGGTVAGARNVISGNSNDGIGILDSSTTSNLVQGNFIGTNVTGTAALANNGNGITIIDSISNTIGGTATGAGNIISGNGINGVELSTFADALRFGKRQGRNGRMAIIVTAASGNQVQGNFIGTGVNGTAAVSNGRDGVNINSGATNNTIGGTTAAARNIISGNGNNGISILTSSPSNTVQGNYIGTDVNGTSGLGNALAGVGINNSSMNLIGGTVAGAANIIAFNGDAGVHVFSGTGNGILGNSIFSNSALGINLSDDAVTANDDCDADSGANNLQNFPVLTSVTSGQGGTTIKGSLNSTASTNFRIEFFSTPTCDSSGNGQGQTFLGATNVTTNGSCNANINVNLPAVLQTGGVVTATATDPGNNTSEFSACTVVTPGGGGECFINCPSNITVNNTPNRCGAVVTYPTPTAGEGCGAVSCKPISGAFFNVGTTTVNCTLTGGESCSFQITVKDQTRPQISCPQNITATLPGGQTTAIVNYTNPPATDNCPGVHVFCSPASGTAFPAGTTTVTCTATDNNGNTANCSFSVNVVADTQPPIITCPANVTAQADAGQSTAVVTYPAPTATDNLPGVTANCVPPSGSVFQLGSTTVNCTATDVGGNLASCSFTVFVQGGPPQGQVSIPGNKPNVEFPATPARRKPAKNAQCSNFSVTNTGRTPLDLTFESILRTGADVDNHRITDPNEDDIYQLSRINANGVEVLIPIGSKVTIGIGETVTFCAKFIPLLPRVSTDTTGLAAPSVLSDVITSKITFRLSNGNVLTVNLLANVATDFVFINPTNTRKPPLITFVRQGDNYVLTYAIFDSNLDVKSSRSELLDSNGNVVATFDVDLQQPIRDRNLVRGQSFIVEQRFTGANANPQVTAVRLTVTDGTSSTTVTQSLGSASAALRMDGDIGTVVSLPPVKIKK